METVLVGAGLAGLYAAHGLRTANIDFQGIEAAPAVGGTWYWNRYPGCRCDAPSIEYSYGFDPELEQSWSFSESMAAQPEIERYLNHVADRHGLRQHFHFGTRVLAAHYDETRHRWTVTTDRGDTYSARWCIMATGPLSAPNSPAIPGVESFAGQILHTARWPTSPVSFAGKRVGVIGTGSSGIQVIPQIAATARQLWVFQRTANYTLPADLVPMDPGFERHIKAHYREIRRRQRSSKLGISGFTLPAMFAGGEARPVGEGALPDLSVFSDPVLNQQMQDNFASMVRERVHDPRTADTLIPKDYPFACKRLVIENGYFETFNRENVRLVDLRESPIVKVTPAGILTQCGFATLDVLVLATGFDAFAGPLTRIDIRGRAGDTLAGRWAHEPRAYLGLMAAGFPNMFLIHGPGSPSVLTNMFVSSEQQVELIVRMLQSLRSQNAVAIDATAEAEESWLEQVAAAAQGSHFTAPTCQSWYLGSNIQGRRRRFIPYVGGADRYQEICARAIAAEFAGFALTKAA